MRLLSEPPGDARSEALDDLGNYLLRVTLVYLTQHRGDLSEWSRQDLRSFAEDISQDAIIKILEKLDTFKGKSKFTTWAYRIAINLTASELRRSRYRDLSLDFLLDEESSTFQSLLSDPHKVDPERIAEQHNFLNLLQEIIANELNERQRAAIVGVYLKGLSLEEVAIALETSRNALYKLLHDARKRLKARLQEHHLTQGDILTAFEN